MDIQMPQSTSQMMLRMNLIAPPSRACPARSHPGSGYQGCPATRPAIVTRRPASRLGRPRWPAYRGQTVPLPRPAGDNHSGPADVIDVSRLAEPLRHEEPHMTASVRTARPAIAGAALACVAALTAACGSVTPGA